MLDNWAGEVTAAGASFHVVRIPERGELAQGLAGAPPDPNYTAFWETLRGRYRVIDPTEALLEVARAGSLAAVFMPGGHYSRAGNQIVADAIATSLGVRSSTPH